MALIAAAGPSPTEERLAGFPPSSSSSASRSSGSGSLYTNVFAVKLEAIVCGPFAVTCRAVISRSSMLMMREKRLMRSKNSARLWYVP